MFYKINFILRLVLHKSNSLKYEPRKLTVELVSAANADKHRPGLKPGEVHYQRASFTNPILRTRRTCAQFKAEVLESARLAKRNSTCQARSARPVSYRAASAIASRVSGMVGSAKVAAAHSDCTTDDDELELVTSRRLNALPATVIRDLRKEDDEGPMFRCILKDGRSYNCTFESLI